MKPELILQSNVLDIIFENKNKDYGAYALRKNYNKRVLQALGGTCAFVGLFILLQSMRPADKTEKELVYNGRMIEIPRDPIKEPEKEKQKPAQKKQVPTIQSTAPVIKDVPETRMPPVDSLEGRQIDKKTNDIPSSPGGDPPPGQSDPPKKPGDGIKPDTDPEPQETGPLHSADVMPTFNGDLVKFMIRNLRQPDDIDEGQKIIVKIRFVVTAEGNIDDVQLVQSGRSDLDEEVLRVVKKMPRWRPGMQGGRNVPVYFYLPVTFVSNAE
jgi:protein TonB